MQDSCYSTKIEEIIRENAGALNMKIFQPIAIYTLHLYCMCRDSRVRYRKNLIYFSWGSLTIFNLASFGCLIV